MSRLFFPKKYKIHESDKNLSLPNLENEMLSVWKKSDTCTSL